MKRIASRLLYSFILVVLVLGGYQFLESSTYPERAPEAPAKHYYSSVEVPDSLTFAGEKVPLEYFDVYESLDRELLVNSYFHSQTLRFMKLAPRFFSIIEPILEADSIPEDFKYLALAESGFNPKAVSPAGAVGFWQFMKGTARDYGLEVSGEVDERYHIEKSTHAACAYLHESYKKYGSWTLVAATYNAGRSFVGRQLERQQETEYYDLLLGEETGRYVFRILALKLVMENPQKYGFDVQEDEQYSVWNTKTVSISGPVANFADFAQEHQTNYKILKMLNPWLRESYLTNKSGKTYGIKLPAEGFRTNTK
ncbi:lytic transglycosylase domain-containing protein [Sunxiuqinia elliptica]|uniref:Transglycosylase-like protein with SLT domain n=1 Tax=Sunxiuqinia elliptica TaxID=655355 RepID=A0A4R6HA47_9BACT|nr:lytic transglycosylase domain-containing protein [Sunxiuqinia elliptica]TDO04788.1 transglycosylase-like protein with SLT domain [Sunxiuqinia elliptica]TDO64335.1 transglycosylase-like protein with SLT domain [Sunxiuqinia elliptica]